MNSKVKKLLPIAAIMLTVLVCVLWIVIQNSCREPGRSAEVRVNGTAVMTLLLNEDKTVELEGANGIRLKIVTGGGGVHVEHSECPDKICVNKGIISDVGDTIICMPARVVIEVMEI